MSDCNLFIAASDYGVMKARKGLRYDGEFMVEGMPRNDKLVNISVYKDEAARIKERIGVAPDTKILLYAPTLRDGKKDMQCVIEIEQTMKSLKNDGCKWICLVRAHAMMKKVRVSYTDEEYLDVTDYPDMADLLLVADMLITDYSSCAGDFLLTGKPVVLAHFDRDDYQDKHRELWVNVEEAGYLVAKNQQELNGLLSRINAYNHQEIDQKILNYYGTKESGNSAEAVVRRILDELSKR
jgi:CDP-glycerol glycerophosphotransferase